MFGFGRKKSNVPVGHDEIKQGINHSGNITVLQVQGMTCMHCKMSVERALNSVEGVESSKVDLMRKEAVVIGSAAKDVLVKAVEDAGYSVIN